MAANFVDITLDEQSFREILGPQVAGTSGFGLSARAVTVFTADYATIKDLMDSDEKQIKQVIKNINSTFRDHDTANRRCYINAIMTKRILAFYYWTVFAIKEGGAEYDANASADFDRDWISSIMDAYTMEQPEATSQSTAFSVTVTKYTGTNWFDVRGQIIQLMSTRIGHAGIPLSYILRDGRKEWDDTEGITSLQDRRIATKMLEGPTFDLDNKEVYRILSNVLGGTTLEDDINKFKVSKHGKRAWDSLTAIVEGASYATELKRQGDAIIKDLFYDPTKNFSFERYYQLHARSHEIFAAAGDPVAEWRKISQFMNGIRCTKLQDDYRGMRDDNRYLTFSAFFNKIAENYRTLVAQKIIKPVSIYKRKINSLTNEDSGGRGRGRGRGRGNGRGGRDGGGRYGGRYGGRGGRGRGGRDGRGRGRGRGRGYQHDISNVDLSCLPNNLDLTNLTFTDDVWYGFDQQQKDAVNALRAFRNQERQVNSFRRGNGGDETSTLDTASQPPVRHVYEISVNPNNGVPLPPRANGDSAPQPPSSSSGSHRGSTPSHSAGSAFGRRGN